MNTLLNCLALLVLVRACSHHVCLRHWRQARAAHFAENFQAVFFTSVHTASAKFVKGNVAVKVINGICTPVNNYVDHDIDIAGLRRVCPSFSQFAIWLKVQKWNLRKALNPIERESVCVPGFSLLWNSFILHVSVANQFRRLFLQVFTKMTAVHPATVTLAGCSVSV